VLICSLQKSRNSSHRTAPRNRGHRHRLAIGAPRIGHPRISAQFSCRTRLSAKKRQRKAGCRPRTDKAQVAHGNHAFKALWRYRAKGPAASARSSVQRRSASASARFSQGAISAAGLSIDHIAQHSRIHIGHQRPNGAQIKTKGAGPGFSILQTFPDMEPKLLDRRRHVNDAVLCRLCLSAMPSTASAVTARARHAGNWYWPDHSFGHCNPPKRGGCANFGAVARASVRFDRPDLTHVVQQHVGMARSAEALFRLSFRRCG